MRSRRVLALVTVSALLLTSCGPPAELPTPQPTIPAPDAIALPPPPSPLTLPASDPPKAQAATLVEALSGDPPGRLAGWLAAYEALGVPVLMEDGSALGATEDDPVGVPYWHVWYASVFSRVDAGLPLSDVVRFFSVPDEAAIDATRAGEALLNDLRAALSSADPQVRLFGELFAEFARRGPASVELSDPTLGADDIFISAGAAELLSWVAIRDVVFGEASAEVAALRDLSRSNVAGRGGSPDAVLAVARDQGPRPTAEPVAPAKKKCSEAIGSSEDVTYWWNWVVNKLAGGLDLPGMEKPLRSFTALVHEYFGGTREAGEKTQKITGIVSLVMGAVSLALQFGALQLDGYMDPQPLVRTRETRDNGREATIHLKLSSDLGQLLDGDQAWACAAAYFFNALGLTLSVPPRGPIVGAEVEFGAGQGIGDYVLFRDADYRRKSTNEHGEVSVVMIGKAQPRELPRDAQPWMREFSVTVQAAPTAVTATTLFDIFFAGLGGLSPVGAMGAAIEIAKTLKWDFGEQVFPIQDWRKPGFRIQATTVQVTTQPNLNPYNVEATFDVFVEAVHDGIFRGEGTVAIDQDGGAQVGGACPALTHTRNVFADVEIEGDQMLLEWDFGPNPGAIRCEDIMPWSLVVPLSQGNSHMNRTPWVLSIPAAGGSERDGYTFDGAVLDHDCGPNAFQPTFHHGDFTICLWHVEVSGGA